MLSTGAAVIDCSWVNIDFLKNFEYILIWSINQGQNK
jgi:hypothetical protein